MDTPKFTYVSYIRTTPEKLWTALTSGDATQQYWWGRRIESAWQKGSPLKLTMENGEIDVHGEIVHVEKSKMLSYTFSTNCAEEYGKEAPSRVTFQIEPQNANIIKLTVTHDAFEPGSKVYEGICEGWPGILSGLKSVVETGVGIFNRTDGMTQ